MTDTRLTQAALEQWLATNPQMQLTQTLVEQWASAAAVPPQVVLSQIAVEQWAEVAAAVSSTQSVRIMVLA